MIKVTISEDARNDLRCQFISDFNLAFAKNDTAAIIDCFADNAHWQMVGGQSWDGRAAIRTALDGMSDGEASEMIIYSVISQGSRCVSNGLLKYGDGTSVAYCDVYTFTSEAPKAQIQDLTAYAIELKS